MEELECDYCRNNMDQSERNGQIYLTCINKWCLENREEIKKRFEDGRI